MEENTKTICLNFKQELEKFTHSVHTLSQDGSLSREEHFLLNMAETIDKLYKTSMQISNCQDEELKEIGALIQNIFLQPLTNTQKKTITLKNAVDSFSSQQAKSSELSALLYEYVNYPDSTESFIRELELISEDLNSALGEVI